MFTSQPLQRAGQPIAACPRSCGRPSCASWPAALPGPCVRCGPALRRAASQLHGPRALAEHSWHMRGGTDRARFGPTTGQLFALIRAATSCRCGRCPPAPAAAIYFRASLRCLIGRLLRQAAAAAAGTELDTTLMIYCLPVLQAAGGALPRLAGPEPQLSQPCACGPARLPQQDAHTPPQRLCSWPSCICQGRPRAEALRHHHLPALHRQFCAPLLAAQPHTPGIQKWTHG